MAKETYVHGKRDLCTWQKRPMYMAKETYVHGKRDLCVIILKMILGLLPGLLLQPFSRSLDACMHPGMSHHHTCYVTSSYMLCHIIAY